MNNREDFLDQVAEYLGIPERDMDILDGMRSIEVIKANSDIIEDVDIPQLEYTLETFEDFFDVDGNFTGDVINARLDTQASQILSEYTFGASGAIAMAADADNGLWLSPSGILGKKAGANTFAIDNSGNATFAGTLAAASGILGAITIGTNAWNVDGSGNMWWGSATSYAAASIKISSAGVADLTGANISGSITITGGSGISNLSDAGSLATKSAVGATDCDSTIISGGKIITGLLTASNITTGTLTGITLTGNTIQTATSGRRITISNDQLIRWKNGTDTEGLLYNNTDGDMVLDCDGSMYITATGNGDSVTISSGEDILLSSGDDIFHNCNTFNATCTGNWVVAESDICAFFYNSDNDVDSCQWRDDSGESSVLRMNLDNLGNLFVDGGVEAASYADFAEYFEATSEFSTKKIKPGTSVVLKEGKIRPAKKSEIPFGVVSSSAGLVLNGGSSETGTQWGKKYLADEFGEKIYEEAEWWSIEGEVERTAKNGKKKKLPKRISNYSDIEKPPKDAKKKMVMREKLNPEWNPNKKYIPRKDRPEWNVVGLIGQVAIRKGQPVAPNWIKMREISENVDLYLIK